MYVIPDGFRKHIPLSVCTYCGARSGNDPKFLKLAREFGSAIASENWRLVYGAGNCGLMGTIAETVQNAGGEVFGVIPTHMPEQVRPGLDHIVFTCNMNERKNVLQVNSDAFVIMPGGIGTLDELFEVLTLKQLGEHNKPIHILNAFGYWDNLLQLIEGVISNDFASKQCMELLKVDNSVHELVNELRLDFSTLMKSNV